MRQRLNRVAKWALLAAVTVAVTVPLSLVGVPSAALFAALVVGVALAIPSLAPKRVPRPLGIAAQGVLGVYIGTMVHRDAVSALGPDWQIVVVVAVATLLLSIVAGALLGLHRDVSPLTGSLALVAGGASGLVAIARELGGDDRVVAVVQYLRVALVTASMPVVVTLFFHADRSHHSATSTQTAAMPWYLSVAMMALLIFAGAAGGRLLRLPGAGLLGPLALTVVLQVTGLSFGLSVPAVLVQVGYMVIGWQAGRRVHPGGAARGRADAACGHRPDRRARRRHRRPRRRCWPTSPGRRQLEGYLATSPAVCTPCWQSRWKPDPTSRSSSPPRWSVSC